MFLMAIFMKAGTISLIQVRTKTDLVTIVTDSKAMQTKRGQSLSLASMELRLLMMMMRR